MSWVLVAIPLLTLSLIFVVAYRRSRRAWQASRTQLERCDRQNLVYLLRYLLVSGFDEGWMMLEDRSTRLRVQFKKYVKPGAEIGLEQIFPRAAWSEPFYSRLQSLLRDRDIKFSRVVVQEDNAPPEYISVDYGTDVALAADVAHEIFIDLFCIPEPRLRIECDGIGCSREAVTTTGHPTFMSQLRDMRELIRNRHKPT